MKIYRTTILVVVLYRYKTWSLSHTEGLTQAECVLEQDAEKAIWA
jgi:hypothetical protein